MNEEKIKLFQQAIGDSLKDARLALRIGRPKAAVLTGVPASTIHNTENVVYEQVLPTVLKMAVSYGINPAQLIRQHLYLLEEGESEAAENHY